jgi:hypothetical protein
MAPALGEATMFRVAAEVERWPASGRPAWREVAS